MNLFRPEGKYHSAWSRRLLVLSPGDIPTVDFYVRSRVERSDRVATTYRDSRILDAKSEASEPGTFVIIVRHACAAWLRYLLRHKACWSGVAFLMDDNIPQAWRCLDVPVDYGFWTTGRYLGVSRMLSAVCDRVWVSTRELQSRYAQQSPQLVPPLALAADYQAAPAGCWRWGYHGTRIHKRELHWLVPVVEGVQAACPGSEFEVFGDSRVVRLFAHIPRVQVLTPRPWAEYLAHCRSSPLAVGLAPLLPGRFNATRSYVKIFDITRCGAVGVFSDCEPYAPALARAGACLLPNDPARWVAEICHLLGDDALRLWHFEEAVAWVEAQGRNESIDGVICGENSHLDGSI